MSFSFLREFFGRALERRGTLIIFAILFAAGALLGLCFINTPAAYDFHLENCDRYLRRVCYSVLSTCNRLEVYLFGADGGLSAARRAFGDLGHTHRRARTSIGRSFVSCIHLRRKHPHPVFGLPRFGVACRARALSSHPPARRCRTHHRDGALLCPCAAFLLLQA